MKEARIFPATSMPDRDWWAILWPDPEGVIRSLGVEPGMVVVDLCCGDGYFTVPLARLVAGEVYGIDIDPLMIARSRGELDRARVSVRDLICADALDLPSLLPTKVDYVFIANTYHGVPDKPALARAVAAVLRSGGLFAVVNWHPLPREVTAILGRPRGPATEMRMSSDAVRSAVEPAGFELDEIVELRPFHYGAVFRATGAADAALPL